MTLYWVGLESTHNPNGYGEDFREYVTTDDGEAIRAAIIRIVNQCTIFDNGDRIAVRRVDG